MICSAGFRSFLGLVVVAVVTSFCVHGRDFHFAFYSSILFLELKCNNSKSKKLDKEVEKESKKKNPK